MRINIYKISMILITVLSYNTLLGQQTPVFSEYNYNTILINSAHAGFSPDPEITITNRGYLNSIEGSPRNLSAIFNTSFNSKKAGLGIGVIHDEIGVTTSTTISASYAYKIFFDHHYNRGYWWEYNPNVLSFGITGGILIQNENLVSLDILNDPNFGNNINSIIPTIGLGFLYNRNQVYAGFSAPNLLGDTLSSEDNINLEFPLYAYAGYRFFTSKFQKIMIKPNVLLKYVSGAPAQIDLNTTINYKNIFELGTGYRTNSSINFLAGIYALKYYRILFNYTTNLKNTPINNSFGIILSYRFKNGSSK